MSASANIQNAIADALASAGALRVAVPVISRRTKNLTDEIAAAVANQGLCVYAMPPLPKSALIDVPFVFFDHTDIRVRALEKMPMNTTGADAWDLIFDAAQALQWTNPGRFLAHPMQLAARCVEKIENENKTERLVDVIFDAPWQSGSGPRASAPFIPNGKNAMEDLHAAVENQLRFAGQHLAEVPIVRGQPKDVDGKIEVAAAGQGGLWIEIDPPIPARAMQGVSFVFYEEAEIVVRIKEVPAANVSGVDAYDLFPDVAESLHWQELGGGWLAQPLLLDRNPIRENADPNNGTREIAVVFNATFSQP